MQSLMFRCPRTGREIGSGIRAESSALIRLFSLRVRCPACEELHEWHVSEGLLCAHTTKATDPTKSAFIPTRATPHEVLRDLGLSDGEINTYFVRFSNARINLFEDRAARSKCSPRLSADVEHVELLSQFYCQASHARRRQKLDPRQTLK